MIFLVIGLVLTAVLYLILGFTKYGKKLEWRRQKKQFASLLGLLVVVFGFFTQIPAGHTGIVVTFGNVENFTLEAGLHVKLPWQNVVIMDNRAQKSQLQMSCFSSDIQDVAVSYSINYQINKENAQEIYKTIGTDYYNVVMEPRIQEAVKSVIAKYTAENLISSREELSNQINTILEEELAGYNIVLINTAVEDLDFSDAFTNAVEEKQVAEQQKLKAQIEQAQLNIEAEAAAEREVIAANADAEVTKIQADVAQYAGEKEAEANRKIADTLTDLLVQYYYATNWDGALPQIVGSDTVLPVLGNYGNSSAETAE